MTGHMGKTLREIRLGAGMTVPEVCVGTKLSISTVQHIEASAAPNIKLDTLKKLLDLYNVKMSDFFQGLGE